jgi:hypothetical protein
MLTDKELDGGIAAALGFGQLAGRYVTQQDIWPAFLAWASTQPGEKLSPAFTPDMARTLVRVLVIGTLAALDE